MLNANYVLRSLEDVLDAPFAFSGPCMHEAIFSDKGFAGGLLDDRRRQGADRRGLPPDDDVFPAGRPRRDAGRADRDREQGGPRPVHRALRSIAERARAGDESLKAAPIFAPRRRLDETLAARKPVLAYKTPAPDGAEAERRGDGDGRWRLTAASTKAPAGGAKRSAPAALRNREPIAEVLARVAAGKRGWCSKSPAGRGEHAVYFARALSRARVAAERRRSRRAGVDRRLARGRGWPMSAPPIVIDAAAAGLASRPRRCDPQHQHGAHQPVGFGARPARRRGAAARARRRR